MLSSPTQLLVLGYLVGFGLALGLMGLASLFALHDGSESIMTVFTLLLPMLVAHAVLFLWGFILTLLWSWTLHLCGGRSMMDLIPPVLVAVVVCTPVNTYISEGWELPVLVMLALQSYACIWAFRLVVTLVGHMIKMSQRLSGKIHRFLKRAAALTSTACELRRAHDSDDRKISRSLPRELAATTAELEEGQRELVEATKAMQKMKRERGTLQKLCDIRGRKIDKQRDLLVLQGNNSVSLLRELQAANLSADETEETLARQREKIEDMNVDAVKAQAKIAELQAQIASLSSSMKDEKLRLPRSRKDMIVFGTDVTPNNYGSAATMACTVSPSGSSPDILMSPGRAPPSPAGSSLSSSLKGSIKKTKGEKRQARKLASKRSRMPVGALAVRSTEG